MSVNKASPIEMRKALEMVEEMKRLGIEFVPVPVKSPEHKSQLQVEFLQSIAELAHQAEEAEKAEQKVYEDKLAAGTLTPAEENAHQLKKRLAGEKIN